MMNKKLGQVTDGYHTFDELYEHRHMLWIMVCKRYGSMAWRARKHSDGSMYEGWFVLGLGAAPGRQLTYHLPLRLWDLCDGIIELSQAPEFDGHTSNDVLGRLKAILMGDEPLEYKWQRLESSLEETAEELKHSIDKCDDFTEELLDLEEEEKKDGIK